MSKIGSNIRKIRSVKSLSQVSFAQLFNLTRASVGAYEEGRAEPKIDTVIEVAKYFSISLGDMFTKDLTVNQLTNFRISEESELKKPIEKTERQLNLAFVSSTLLMNKKEFIKQLGIKNNFNKIRFPYMNEEADTYFHLEALLVLGLRNQNVKAIVCLTINKPIGNTMVFAISTNDMLYGTLINESLSIKLADTGEITELRKEYHLFEVKQIISSPHISPSYLADQIAKLESRITQLEK
ncbi:MAG: helix-turn-helix transcriptional regulator [Flavobacteriales bacterium]|nr:helix-turn-helix transcriptional regulator [Flavobacteriales bacterium]